MLAHATARLFLRPRSPPIARVANIWKQYTTRCLMDGARSVKEDSCASSSEPESSPETSAGQPSISAKEERKLRKKSVKEEKRLKREGAVSHGQKPCALCSRERNLLIRCNIDASKTWHMICGRCWQAQTGGKPDGDPKINPHYRYGGLWKNHHQQISGKNKVPKPRSREEKKSSIQSHDASWREEEDRALEVKLQSLCR